MNVDWTQWMGVGVWEGTGKRIVICLERNTNKRCGRVRPSADSRLAAERVELDAELVEIANSEIACCGKQRDADLVPCTRCRTWWHVSCVQPTVTIQYNMRNLFPVNLKIRLT
eukprot:gene11888-biopygen5346